MSLIPNSIVIQCILILYLSTSTVLFHISSASFAFAHATESSKNENNSLDTKHLIHQFLSEHKQKAKYRDFLVPFIESRSLQGNESHTQSLVTKWLKDMKFDHIDTYHYSDLGDTLTKHPLFNSPRDSFDESPVVVGTLNSVKEETSNDDSSTVTVDINGEQHLVETAALQKKAPRSLILNGHVDVVPIEDDSQFAVKEENGRLYGRGSTDMKGGIYASMLALEAILHGLKKRPAGQVIFESVVEEESGGSGSLSTILRGYTADAAIVPEPSELKIFPVQQGSMWFNITVYGKAAHGASRYDGVSAIEKAMLVMKKILSLEEKRNVELKKKEPMCSEMPIPVPINVGQMKGGKWPSSVPDYVEMHGRMGIIPGEDVEAARESLRNAMSQLAEEDEWFRDHPVQVKFYGAAWPPGNVSPDADVVQTLVKAYKETLQKDPVVGFAPWATDCGYLSTVGETPAIVFGPGETAKAHQADENIEIEKIYECAETIANFIVEWCGLGDL